MKGGVARGGVVRGVVFMMGVVRGKQAVVAAVLLLQALRLCWNYTSGVKEVE